MQQQRPFDMAAVGTPADPFTCLLLLVPGLADGLLWARGAHAGVCVQQCESTAGSLQHGSGGGRQCAVQQ